MALIPSPLNRFQHTDALGSPVLVTDGSRNQVGTRTEYEPYGQILAGGVADRPNFTGHVADAQTSMDYMQQRYYDPMLGRFLSVDPVTATSVGGNFNRYWYASDNPYRFIDPDGRDDEDAQKGREAAEIQKKDDQRRAEHGQGPGTRGGTLSQSRVDGAIAGSKYNGRGSSGGNSNGAGGRTGINAVDVGLTGYGLMAPKKMGDFVQQGESAISKWEGATRDQLRFARNAAKVGSVISYLTLALSANDLRVAIRNHDSLDITTSSVDLGVGLGGLGGPVGAAGASAYGGTQLLLQIPVVHKFVVTGPVDVACRVTGNCQ